MNVWTFRAPVIGASLFLVGCGGEPTPSSGRMEGEVAGEKRVFGGIEMVWCPSGQFMMGSPETEQGRATNENQVEVELTQGFWLGETEVTQAQWRTIMGSEPWKDRGDTREGDRYPAMCVRWEEAVEFCHRLTEQERLAGRLSPRAAYRLPTEAQWEYACRAGGQTAFSFGDDASVLGDYEWFEDNAWNKREMYAHLVGQKLPNGWNLRDMHGNCCEWCLDWYADDLPRGIDPLGPSEGEVRVNRGGSWGVSPRYCRSSVRNKDTPEARFNYLGFRVAAVPVPENFEERRAE